MLMVPIGERRGRKGRRSKTAARARELDVAAGFAEKRLRVLQFLGLLPLGGRFLRCHGFSFVRIAPMGGHDVTWEVSCTRQTPEPWLVEALWPSSVF